MMSRNIIKDLHLAEDQTAKKITRELALGAVNC